MDYKEIIEEDWPDIAYTVTKEETAYFVKSDEGWDLAVILNPKENWDKGLSRMVYERYQEVKDLYGEKESSEEIRYLTNFTKVRLRNGETREKGKRVYIIPTEFDTEKGVEDEKIGEMLLRLKEDITRDERKKCIFAAADGINRAKCRTILECLFSNTETEIICRLPGNRSTDGENKVKRPIDSTVTIKAGNETYSNLLKKFKGNVDIEKIGVDIRRIRKAGKEYLILTVAGGQKKSGDIENEDYEKYAGHEGLDQKAWHHNIHYGYGLHHHQG